MPVKRDYSAFSSVLCSTKMPMWRTYKVSCTIIRNLDFQKLASLLLCVTGYVNVTEIIDFL